MTFLLAANLPDRIILASDSKVTKITNSQRIIAGYSIKLVQYIDRPINKDIKVKNPYELGNFVSCMYAGNKSFSLFIHNRLVSAFEYGQLSADINILQQQINDFFSAIVPTYDGVKECTIIFAGNSLNGSNKIANFKSLTRLIGKGGGKIEDPVIAGGLRFASTEPDIIPLYNPNSNTFIPEQKIFSFKIHEEKSIFGIDRIGDTYSIISGGSFTIDNYLETELLRYFLNKREIDKEANDIINFIRNKFSDTIGGAVILGYIKASRGALNYLSYDIDRSGQINDKNWSVSFEDNSIFAIDPTNNKINLVQGFFDKQGDNSLYI